MSKVILRKNAMHRLEALKANAKKMSAKEGSPEEEAGESAEYEAGEDESEEGAKPKNRNMIKKKMPPPGKSTY